MDSTPYNNTRTGLQLKWKCLLPWHTPGQTLNRLKMLHIGAANGQACSILAALVQLPPEKIERIKAELAQLTTPD